MSTVIFLSNRDVKAVTGTVKGGRVAVDGAYRAQAPDGAIINGHVINEESFCEFLNGFWEKNRLPRKDVALVLGSSQTVTRVLEVPKMSHRKLMEYLPREFANTEDRKDPVFGYEILGREGTMVKLAATMAERTFLEPHVRRFKDMGIRLSSIASSAVADMLAVGCLSYREGKTCIVQLLDGMSLINFVYVNGEYFQYNAGRVFGERGTPAFGIECARSISNMQQFLKTQQVEELVTHVYLGGEYLDEDVEICQESILQMDDSLEVEKLYEEPDGAIRFQADGDVYFENFTTPIGGLLKKRGKENLLCQFSQDPDTVRSRQKLKRYAVPAAAGILALAGVSVAQAAVWFKRTEQVNRQLDYLGNQAVIENVAEYDRLMAENRELDTRIAVVTKTMDSIAGYPVYTSSIKRVIQECAAGVAAADVTGYEASGGMVSVDASSGNAEGVHQFVDRLENRTDVFRNIYYDGFQYDDKSGSWRASVKCYLAAPVDGQEVEP